MVLPQGLLVCQTLQIMFAGTPYVMSLLPRGDCALCCQTVLEDDIVFTTHFRTGASLRAGVAAGAPQLDPNKPTVVYVHGFTEQGSGASASTIRKAYFATGRDVNFVTMDWSRLCSFPWYSNAVANVPVAGSYLARFLERLFEDGVDPATTHVVGFSLGAEVAGVTGQELQRRYRLGRITGLDPAFPLFRWTRRDGRLSEDDAQFVDVIHTDAGGLGVRRAIGHADFYPNGGRPQQPGCSAKELRETGHYPHEFLTCSHTRAWVYYAESVLRPADFVALRCESQRDFRSGRCEQDLLRANFQPANQTVVAAMGLDAPRSCRGSYFLETNDQFPFARGLSIRSAENLDDLE
ncbi:lipase member H-like [Thrips palmi]|uniref:Lipase member H-like n=1 Tax=Thrips palmi TaxID=161013 RepID=A0A6P8Z2L0_THRPL|nr:lipase member H-like [Thrips palmi]